MGTTATPHKRRKLTSSSSFSKPPGSVLSTKNIITNLACTSCHRATATKGLLILCARCTSPTCAICSRTCSARPPPLPPTPKLSEGNPNITLPSAHRSILTRSILTPNLANTRPNITVTPVTRGTSEKRRQVSDGEDDVVDGKNVESPGRYGHDAGCGRTICRNCCSENLQSDLTTCYDCYYDR